MADFDLYAPKLRKFEGGYVNHPNDPGGPTNCGVTLATYRRHFGEDSDVEDLRAMGYSAWKGIMKEYWDRCKADHIGDQRTAEMLVDWYINCGVRGVKAAQAALGVDADGCVGVRTLEALNRYSAFGLLKEARIAYYRRLVDADPAKGVFLIGWLNRVITI